MCHCNSYACTFPALTCSHLPKYKGMDPEVGYGLVSWASGIDLGTYPQPRTFIVGLNGEVLIITNYATHQIISG